MIWAGEGGAHQAGCASSDLQAEPRDSSDPGKGGLLLACLRNLRGLAAASTPQQFPLCFGLLSNELWAGRLEIGKAAVVQLWHFLAVSSQMSHGGTQWS